ncbi:hypothetical protein [Croceimicrobium sp.]|uniref:hypothetical protein n=1 Tax=Croceimicrobium sp. TaxID=2828340 RepID=UPI003BAD1F3C
MTLRPFFALILLVGFTACKNPTDDVVVHISPDFYDYAISIQLCDLSAPNQVLNSNAQFSLSGADAGEVYVIDGSRNYQFNRGEVALILNRLVLEPQTDHPVGFTLQVDADGFRPKTFYIQVDEEEYFSQEIIYLLPDNPNMNGLGTQSSMASLNNNASLADEIRFDFNTQSDTLPASFSLALDSGVTFLDREGNSISGTSLDVEILGFDTYSDNSTLSLPGSSLIQDMEINGRVTRSFIGPMPRLDINLSVDGKEVKYLQGGTLFTRMNIPEVTNPFTLTTYAEGDSIDVISFDEKDQFWKYLGTEVVQKDSAGKFISVELDNFSSKSFTNVANNQADLHIKVKTSGHIMLYNDFKAEFTGNDGTYSKLLNRTANAAFDIKLDPGLILYARVNPTVAFMEVLTGSGIFSSRNPAGSGNSISVQWNSTSDTVVYTLEPTSDVFVGYYNAFCANQPNVLLYPPVGTKVYVKEAGAADYPLAPVHIVTKENKNSLRFETTAVEDGKYYDVKITYSGEDVAERLNILAKYGETIEVEIPSKDCDALGI